MLLCKVCRKLLSKDPSEFFKYKESCGYKVIEKAGNLFYRCSCNRCGHIFLTRSEDAKFQYAEPHLHREKEMVEYKKLRKIFRSIAKGCVYPKSITQTELGELQKDDENNVYK